LGTDANDKSSKFKRILSGTYVSFIDVLFAVVLGQSFILLTSKDDYGTWFMQPYANAFGLFTILLVYGLIISSWVGYHLSVETYPLQSIWRFFIDIILLFLYYFAFANAGNFGTVLLAITASFSAYVAWDTFRIYENRSKERSIRVDLCKRLGWTIVFLCCYVFVYYLYAYAYPLVQGIEWGFLAVAIGLLVTYRYVKWPRTPLSNLPKSSIQTV
jgi:hypothetical protein